MRPVRRAAAKAGDDRDRPPLEARPERRRDRAIADAHQGIGLAEAVVGFEEGVGVDRLGGAAGAGEGGGHEAGRELLPHRDQVVPRPWRQLPQVSHGADQVEGLVDEAPDLRVHRRGVADFETGEGFEMPGERLAEKARPLLALAARRGRTRGDEEVGDTGHRRDHDDDAAAGRRLAHEAHDRRDAIGVPHARTAELVDLDAMGFGHVPPVLERERWSMARGPVKPRPRRARFRASSVPCRSPGAAWSVSLRRRLSVSLDDPERDQVPLGTLGGPR